MATTSKDIIIIERTLQTILRMYGAPRNKVLEACTKITRDPTVANSIMGNLERAMEDPTSLEKIPYGAIRTVYRHVMRDFHRIKKKAMPPARRVVQSNQPTRPKTHPRMSLEQIANGKSVSQTMKGTRASPFSQTNREAAAKVLQREILQRSAPAPRPKLSDGEKLIRHTIGSIWRDTQDRQRAKGKARRYPHTH